MKPRFFCLHCNAQVPYDMERCPSCGRTFTAARCPDCGFEDEPALFASGCPACGYLSPFARQVRKKAAGESADRDPAPGTPKTASPAPSSPPARPPGRRAARGAGSAAAGRKARRAGKPGPLFPPGAYRLAAGLLLLALGGLLALLFLRG